MTKQVADMGGYARCLRNVVALFHVLEKEMAWRASSGRPTFGALDVYKPIVAVGAEHPLEDEKLVEDHFRKRTSGWSFCWGEN
jgi:hypothetical protein